MAPLISRLRRWSQGLRFPWLLALTAAALIIDLLVPDLVPFVDEIALALLTVLLGRLRRPAKEEGPE